MPTSFRPLLFRRSSAAMPNPYLNYTVLHRAQRHSSKLYRTVSAEHNHSCPKIFLSQTSFRTFCRRFARFAILGRNGLEQRDMRRSDLVQHKEKEKATNTLTYLSKDRSQPLWYLVAFNPNTPTVLQRRLRERLKRLGENHNAIR